MKLHKQQNIAMLLLALYPVIDFFYFPPMTFGYGTTVFIICYILSMLKYGLKKYYNTAKILHCFVVVYWICYFSDV